MTESPPCTGKAPAEVRLVTAKLVEVHDPDSPEVIRERQRLFAYADGWRDALEEVEKLIAYAVGPPGALRALRKLRRRAERYADDALPRAELVRRLFQGDW